MARPNSTGSSGSNYVSAAFPSLSGGDGPALKKLGTRNEFAQHLYTRFMERWDSREIPAEAIAVNAIYRIKPAARHIERFDDSIEMNEVCQIGTTYYSGQCLCDSITNMDEFAKPCEWLGCSICLAVRYAFEQVEFKRPSYDGTYGPGIYSQANPANVHKYTVGKSTGPYRVIVQCRVILNRPEEARIAKPYSAMVDEAGRVFCQKEAIIPTHLIVYSVKVKGEK